MVEFDTGLYNIQLRRQLGHSWRHGRSGCLSADRSFNRSSIRLGRRIARDPRLGECGSDRLGDHILYRLTAAKPYLGLGRMYVDIDLLDRNFKKKKGDGIDAVWQHGPVSL